MNAKIEQRHEDKAMKLCNGDFRLGFMALRQLIANAEAAAREAADHFTEFTDEPLPHIAALICHDEPKEPPVPVSDGAPDPFVEAAEDIMTQLPLGFSTSQLLYTHDAIDKAIRRGAELGAAREREAIVAWLMKYKNDRPSLWQVAFTIDHGDHLNTRTQSNGLD